MDLSNLLQVTADLSESALDGADNGDLLFGKSVQYLSICFYISLRAFKCTCVYVFRVSFYG